MVPATKRKENLARPTERLGAGRLGAYAAMGALASAVPIPILPSALGVRLRGALLHDVARRHGLALSKEARELLGEPFGPPAMHGRVGRAVGFAARRVLGRFGPLGALGPAWGWMSTYALGRLFFFYVSELRDETAVRIDAAEARGVRAAMDAALLRVFSTPGGAPRAEASDLEDARDDATKLTDAVLAAVASVPSWLTARLDAAFEAALRARGAGRSGG